MNMETLEKQPREESKNEEPSSAGAILSTSSKGKPIENFQIT
jgi:hypothetical protein